MKNILTFIFLLLLINIAYGQEHMINTGQMKIHPGGIVALYGNFINNGSFADSGTLVMLNGTNKQLIAGTSTTGFRNLQINNSSGAALLRSVFVSDSLILTNGVLDLNTNSIEIDNNSPSAISLDNGYILSEKPDNSSKIIWAINYKQGLFTFPFGTCTGEYIPFLLNHTSGNLGRVTVSTYSTENDPLLYPAVPDQVTNMIDFTGNSLAGNQVHRFWQINNDGPTGKADLTFSATSAETGLLCKLKAQRWNIFTGYWDLPLPEQFSSTLWATVPGVTESGPWTLTGKNYQPNPELTNFTAICSEQSQTMNLAWTTAYENNNDYFTLERSTDCKDWSEVDIKKAAGYSNHLINYYFVDGLPELPYNITTLYYRLKQTDLYGTTGQLGLTYANKCDSPSPLSVLPNPSKGPINLIYNSSHEQNIKISLRDPYGNLVYTSTRDAVKGVNYYTIEAGNLAPETYYLCVMDDTGTRVEKVVVL